MWTKLNNKSTKLVTFYVNRSKQPCFHDIKLHINLSTNKLTQGTRNSSKHPTHAYNHLLPDNTAITLRRKYFHAQMNKGKQYYFSLFSLDQIIEPFASQIESSSGQSIPIHPEHYSWLGKTPAFYVWDWHG